MKSRIFHKPHIIWLKKEMKKKKKIVFFSTLFLLSLFCFGKINFQYRTRNHHRIYMMEYNYYMFSSHKILIILTRTMLWPWRRTIDVLCVQHQTIFIDSSVRPKTKKHCSTMYVLQKSIEKHWINCLLKFQSWNFQ